MIIKLQFFNKRIGSSFLYMQVIGCAVGFKH